jgi:hypothetical protein
MNKIKTLALLLMFSVICIAQKTDTETKKITIPIPKSDFFNALKKYNFIIQGSDKWLYTSEHKNEETFQNYITLQRYKEDKNIDTVNPDMNIIVGFTPTKSFFTNPSGQSVIEGDFCYLILNKNNEVILQNSYNKACVVEKSSSYETTMANALCKEAYEYLDNLLITLNEREFTFNYGFFQKAESIAELVAFNAKTDELLGKLKALSFEDSYLEETQTFYKSYIGKQFGKIKEKDLNKIIYLNLSLIEIFKINFVKAKEYLKIAEDGAGFLSLWPDNAKNNLKRLEFINLNPVLTCKIENLNSKSAYYFTLKGTALLKDKKFTDTFLIPRFKPQPSSSGGSGGIVSLDSYSPNFIIMKDGIITNNYPKAQKFTVKTDNGKDICFRTLKGEIVMVQKNADGTYNIYEGNSNDVYTSSDDEKLELKK